MNFTTDMQPPAARSQYGDLMAAIRTTTAWVCVSATEVGGKTIRQKQTALHKAAESRGIRIITRSADGFIYAKLREAEAA